MKTDLRALIEDHPRTPDGIGLYDFRIGESDEYGRPRVFEMALDPLTVIRVEPQVVERHAGDGWIYGWSDRARVVVVWPDVWAGMGARVQPPRLG